MILGAYDLNDKTQRYPPGESDAGRTAESLVKDDRLRVVLITMRAGATLHDHAAPGPITIQVLDG